MNIYRVKMEEKEFFNCSNKIVACNINAKNGQVYFKTDKITIKFLNENNYKFELMENNNTRIKRNILVNRGIVLGILVFAFLLFMNSYRVSKISFNQNFVINSEIEKEINDDMKKLLFWDFYSGNLEDCAINLRRKYVNYQWISLEKKGTTIKVVINDFDENSVDQKQLVNGDIIATKDGVIKYYTIYRGGNNVEVNKYVKKGDVLISSDLLINKGLSKQDLTEARGIVIANTYETITQVIKKEDFETILTGKTQKYMKITVFGQSINLNKKNSYNKYNEKETMKFNLFNILTFKKIEEIEKCDIIKTYNKDEAIEFAKTIIENDFAKKITSDLEKIERMESVGILEDTESFTIKILVKKQESIGIFQTLNN